MRIKSAVQAVVDDPVAEPRGRRAVHTIESGAAAAATAPNPNSRSGDGGQQAAPAGHPINRSPSPSRARARRARQFSDIGQQADPRHLVEPPGRRCGCWVTSPFLFCEFFFAESANDGARAIGANDDDVGRSGGAGARFSSYGVIDNRSENLQHCQWGAALARLRHHPDRNRTELGGRPNHYGYLFARVRRRADSSELSQQTDPRNLVEPAGRRCGCWPPSPILFGEVRFGATLELGRSGRRRENL